VLVEETARVERTAIAAGQKILQGKSSVIMNIVK
jgi:hypothetical protein